MKKIFIILLSLGAFLQSCTQQKKELSQDKNTAMKSIYDYKVESGDGNEINFADFKGKKILIVNTASECGFTPQYADLEKISKEYVDKVVVVGFLQIILEARSREPMKRLARSARKIMELHSPLPQKFQ